MDISAEEGEASPGDAQKGTNATLAQAATEIKTIVVAQLKETGIQATADELAKIAKIMNEKEPVTNVVINLDGTSIMDFVYNKLSDVM